MKLAMINNLYAPNIRGGAERSVQLLAEALVRSGTEVTVICTEQRQGSRRSLNGVKIISLTPANLHWPFDAAERSGVRRKLWHLVDLYNPIMRRKVEGALREERPDLVHTNNLQGISVSAWHAAKVCGVPILHTLRDYYLSCARAVRFRAGRPCTATCAACVPFSAARRVSSGVVDGVVGTGTHILQSHLGLGFFGRAVVKEVIANPAEAVPMSPRTAPPLVFGFLGRLEPAKGIELLLRTFAAREGGEWELLIAGNGPPSYVETLRQHANGARQPERIRLLGWVDSAEFLRRVDVIVVPSLWHEPLSRAAVEAQSSGRAVIAARRGGLPEVIADGTTGWLFEPDEPGSLGRIIDELLEHPDLAQRFGAAAAAAAQRFRPEAIASRYMQAYEAVLREQSRP